MNVALAERCRFCSRPLEDAGRMRLWDGRDYCRACIEAANPDLERLAATPLEETSPNWGWRAGRNFFVLSVLCLNALFSPIALIEGDWSITAGLQLLILPLSAVFAAACGLGASRRVTASVENGKLRIRSGRSTAVYNLDDCEWFIGSTMNASPFVIGGRVLLIEPPRKVLVAPKYIPVGHSPESLRAWESFLTLAGPLRRTAWEKPTGRLRDIGHVAIGLLLVPVSFAACAGVCGAMGMLLGRLGVPDEYALALTFPGFLPGGVYALAYALVLYPWHTRKRVRSRRPEADRAAEKRRIVAGFLLAGLLCSVKGLLFLPMEIAARATYALTTILISWLLGKDLARRMIDYEPAKTNEEVENAQSAGGLEDAPVMGPLPNNAPIGMKPRN